MIPSKGQTVDLRYEESCSLSWGERKVKGIGDAKAKNLLSHFGSISALKSASEDEIFAVKGISKADAAAIAEYFAQNKK